MTQVFIGALLAGAVVVWAMVFLKLAQQRAARTQRERSRAELEQQVQRLDAGNERRGPRPGSSAR